MAGAVVMTNDPSPMRRPSFDLGDCSRMMFIISGVAMPDPMPWMMRATMSMAKECDTIMMADPVMVKTTAATKTDFSRYRRRRNDDIGMVTDTVTR